jgi:glycosyltransferase involved in cell wall biosynthesis
MRKQKLTLCMIVKNEEKFLRGCLESVKDIVDEIVIVDTGSTDKTVEIAKEYTSLVVNEPWRDDFSHHRNTALKYATGDWVLQIDADELFHPMDGKTIQGIREDIDNAPESTGAFAFNMKDVQGGKVTSTFHVIRLFRTNRVRYEGIVHNRPIVEGDKVFYPGAFFTHYGYEASDKLSSAAVKEKNKRRENLLLKRIAKDPEDWEAVFFLNQHYAVNDKVDMALKYGEKYIANRLKIGNEFRTIIYYSLIEKCLQHEMVDKASLLAQTGFNHTKGADLDLCFALIDLGIKKGEMETTLLGCQKYFKAYERIQAGAYLPKESVWFNYNEEALAFVCYNYSLCRIQEGKQAYENMRKITSQFPNKKYSTEMLGCYNRDLKKLGVKFFIAM